MKTWIEGELITAESLNALEEGVDGAATEASNAATEATNAASAASTAQTTATNAAAAASTAQSTADDAAEAAAGAARIGHTHHRLDNDFGHVTLDSEGGVQQHVGDVRVWWVDGTGRLVEGRVPRLDNTVGRFILDSAGGAQHHVGDTRVWWVDDTGELVEGSIPWERITGAPESGVDTHRLDNDKGYLTIDSAGGLQHGTTAAGRVWWVNHQGELQQGTVPWDRVTGAPDASAATAALKVVPLALTTGHTQVESGHEARGLRFPIRFNAPIHRWRLHVRNWNPRLGQVKTGAVTIGGIWIADHAGNGVTANPRNVMGSASMPSDGSEFVSPWIDEPIGGDVERLLCVGYYGSASIAPYALVGGSWQTEAAGAAGNPGAAVTRHQTTPMDVWIEAETPASTPVIAGVGDSLTSGVGADMPVFDSWVSQYSRRIGGLPVHHSHAGDSLLGFLSVNPGKVTRWADLARADAVVWGLGSNDVSSTRTVAAMQADFDALRPIVEANIGPVHYVSTVQPRAHWDAAAESKRQSWNTWLTERPGVRGVLDFASVVSADGDTIRPEYDSGDGTHLNTAGYAAQAASISTALAGTLPASAEQVASIETRLYDSGLRNITTLASNVTAGAVRMRIKHGHARLTFEGLQVSAASPEIFSASGALQPYAPISPDSGFGWLTQVNTGTTYRCKINSFGRVDLYGVPAATVLNGEITWDFDRTPPATPIGTTA